MSTEAYLAFIFFITSTFIIIKKGANSIYVFPIILLLYDVFFIHTSFMGYNFKDTMGVLIVFFLLFLFRMNKIKHFRSNIWIIIFVFYGAIKIFDSSNIIRATISYTIIFLPFLMFYVGYTNIHTVGRLQKLNNTVIWTTTIFIVNFIISYTFKLGDDAYGLGFYGGGLTRERSFVAALAVVLTPLILHIGTVQFKKRTINLLLLVSVFILFMLLRRSAIIILTGGLLVFFAYLVAYNNSLKKKIALLAVAILPFTFFLDIKEIGYVGNYIEMYELRGRALDRTLQEQLETEGRTMEIELVAQDVFAFQDLRQSFLGRGFFVSSEVVGEYGSEIFGDRPMHTMLAQFLYYTGILGLIIILLIKFNLLRRIFKMKNSNNNNNTSQILKGSYFALLFVFIFINYTKALMIPAFSTAIFLYLGSISRLLEEKKGSPYSNQITL